MSYTINRLETSQNRQGQDEVFFLIMITDELGTYPFAKWLTEIEYNQYLEDNNIDTIIDGYLPLAKSIKQQEIDSIPPVDDDYTPSEN